MELAFHFQDRSLPLDPIVKMRLELLTEAREIELALQGYVRRGGAKAALETIQMANSVSSIGGENLSTTKDALKANDAVRVSGEARMAEPPTLCEESEVKVEGLQLIGVGPGLGDITLHFDLKRGESSQSVTMAAVPSEAAGMWTLKAPFALWGESGDFTITVEATRLFKGDMDFNPPNNSHKLVIGRLSARLDAYFPKSMSGIQSVRISKRFPKISPLASSPDLAVMFGLRLTPPAILASLCPAELSGTDGRVRAMRERHLRGLSDANPKP